MSETKMYKIILQIAAKSPPHTLPYVRQLSEYKTRDIESILRACLHIQKHCP